MSKGERVKKKAEADVKRLRKQSREQVARISSLHSQLMRAEKQRDSALHELAHFQQAVRSLHLALNVFQARLSEQQRKDNAFGFEKGEWVGLAE